jgi:hypothetical protein
MFSPTVWGPTLWDLIFSLAFQTEDMVKFKEFVKLLAIALPCVTCRTSYSLHFESLKHISLNNKEETISWVYKLKRMVNAKLHKSECNIKKEEFMQKYIVYGHTIQGPNLMDTLVMISLASFDKHAEKLKRFFVLIGEMTSKFLTGPIPSLLCALHDASPNSLLQITNMYRQSQSLVYRTIDFYDSAR